VSRRKLYLLALAVFLPGCIPVTEPLSDAATAEPVKGLVGTWRSEMKDRDYYWWEIDIPEVKGNPPGLMRLVTKGNIEGGPQTSWFYVTRLGEHTYMNTPGQLEPGEKYPAFENAPFDREGAFAAWEKGARRRYLIGYFKLDGDRLVTIGLQHETTEKLMKAEGIGRTAADDAYQTPPGWFAKYLRVNGPEKLFNPEYQTVYRRVKE
jgi:hypothetical protein